MNKKIVLGVGLAIVAYLVGIGTNTILGSRNGFKDDNKASIDISENKDNVDKQKVTNLEDIIYIEDGYKTSMIQGETDDETLRINNFLWTDTFSFEDLIKSRNVAENFTQGISLYESSNPSRHLNNAKKYAVKDIDVRVSIPSFAWPGAKENTKEMRLSGIDTECFEYISDSDTLVYEVTIDWIWIDFSDIIASKASTTYIVSVEKIDGEFKVVDYYDR